MEIRRQPPAGWVGGAERAVSVGDEGACPSGVGRSAPGPRAFRAGEKTTPHVNQAGSQSSRSTFADPRSLSPAYGTSRPRHSLAAWLFWLHFLDDHEGLDSEWCHWG